MVKSMSKCYSIVKKVFSPLVKFFFFFKISNPQTKIKQKKIKIKS